MPIQKYKYWIQMLTDDIIGLIGNDNSINLIRMNGNQIERRLDSWSPMYLWPYITLCWTLRPCTTHCSHLTGNMVQAHFLFYTEDEYQDVSSENIATVWIIICCSFSYIYIYTLIMNKMKDVWLNERAVVTSLRPTTLHCRSVFVYSKRN